MNINYCLGDMELDKAEAKALLSHGADEITVTIDLRKHIKTLDSKKLFAQAIDTKDTRLAALAAKLAMEGGPRFNPGAKRPYRKTGEKSVIPSEVIAQDPFDSMEEILSRKCLKHVGAAMILSALESGNRSSVREIADDTVTHLEKFGQNSPSDSPRLFKGFKKTKQGYRAILNKEQGVKPFHQSPVYRALREGLKYLASVGLVDIKSEKTFGALDQKRKEAGHLQRSMYTVALTKGAMKLMRNWSDCEDYISASWRMVG